MEEKINDLNLKLDWGRTGESLKVYAKIGTNLKVDLLAFNSVTGFVSPLLSERQVKWIKEVYEKKRKKYVFG